MADAVVSGIFGKVVEYAIDPILRQFKYFIFYSSNIRNLRDRMKDLEIKESEVQQSVDVAERNAEDIKPGVRDWQQKVDSLKMQANEVLNGAMNSEMQCQFLGSPNLKTRYSLGRKAKKMTADVVKLQREGTFQKVGEPKAPVQIPPYHNPSDCGAFKTRMSTKEKIMEALKDNDINIIGICGMPGVGKTTMATEIANEVNVNKLFDEVAMAVVSNDPDITKIQDQLADMLGLTIEEKSNESVRAGRLRKRLVGDRGKSILVIVDDVWEDIDLGKIGIPSGHDAKRLKILLTSRFEDVCGRLGAQRKFDVNVLSKEESWELFKDSVGISHDATYVIKGIAEEVAMECGGLPLALVTVGKALRKREEYAWKNALKELRTSRVTNIKGVHKLVYSRIEFSYNYLESDEAKSLLLLFSLYPEDYSVAIEDMVKYVSGLELFKDTKTLMETRDRVNSIVDDLKSCYLLLSGQRDGHVKLHDVVRDACLQISSKYKHAYMSQHTGLREWPDNDTSESYNAISLTLSYELNQLPSGLEYLDLRFLRLRCQGQTLRIPKGFFERMKELRVVGFKGMEIQIPSSIQLLTSLRTLCLDDCKLINDISRVGSLTKLEVLSFLGSDLDHLPNGITQLSNLRSLDLRLKCTTSYRLFPPGILSHLKKLEELYLGAIEIRGDELEQRRYIIEEISSLTHLNTFQISTDNPQFLLEIIRVLCIDELERFHIRLTDISKAISSNFEHYDFGRRLHVRHTHESMLSQPVLNSLMSRADYLSIEMEEHNLDYFSVQIVERKNMLDEYCGFEYLTDTRDGNYQTEAFSRLQEIDLRGLPRMKHLWRGVIKPPSFHNLTTLNMRNCPSVKSLFSVSAALSMVNLESVLISDCELLEEVVSVETEQNEVSEYPIETRDGNYRTGAFARLQEIYLRGLPSMKHLWRGVIKPPSLHNLTRLDIEVCPCVKSLFSVSVALSMVNLQRLSIFKCELLEEVVETKQNEVCQMLEFPKLREIALSRLSNFMSFRSEPNEDVGAIRPLFNQVTFSSLESLTIEGLKRELNIMYELRKIKSHELKALTVSSEDDVSTLFDFEVIEDDSEISILGRLKSLYIQCLPKLVHITRMVPKGIGLFRNLTSVTIAGCGSLRYLFSASLVVSLVALETVWVYQCEAIEEIIGRQETEGMSENEIVFPKLRSLGLVSLDRFRMFSSQNYQLVFPSLVSVNIKECPLMENFCSGQITAPRLNEVESSKGIHGFSWDNFRPTEYSGSFWIREGHGPPVWPI